MEKITIQLSPNITVEVSGENRKELIKSAAFYSGIPNACPVCHAAVAFIYRNPQDYHYYGVRCVGSPAHETNFGEHKTGGTLYYKEREAWTSYQPGNGQPQREDVSGGSEPTAELERLRKQIKLDYPKLGAQQSLEAAIQARTGTTIDNLPIAKLREILDGIQARLG